VIISTYEGAVRMGKKTSIALVCVSIIVVVLLLSYLNVLPLFDILFPPEVEGATIEEIKASPRDYIGAEVKVQGFYICGDAPLLCTDFSYYFSDQPLPDVKYIVLIGEIPSCEYMGYKLEVTGTLREYEIGDPANVADEPIMIYVSEYTPLTTEPAIPVSLEVVYEFEPQYFVQQHRGFAVLISGGIDHASNYPRYWNHLRFMYDILVNDYGYDPDRVYVLYANGTGRDASVPVFFPADQHSIEILFEVLAEKMTDWDTLFVFATDHGGGCANYPWEDRGVYGGRVDVSGEEHERMDEAGFEMDLNGDGDWNDLVPFDQSINLWGEDIFDDEFAELVNGIEHYHRMIFLLVQCFSGGFITDLSGPRRIILTSAGPCQFAYAFEGGQWSVFVYDVMSALHKATPYGAPVDADDNDDGYVSMLEAFNYAERTMEPEYRSIEIPLYDDNGDGYGSNGQMPAGGDGALGSNTYLSG